MGDRQFNEGQFEAARLAWKASAGQEDIKTQKALERLSATYFFASMGMDRGRGAGRAQGVDDALPAAREQAQPSVTRVSGGETHRARSEK